MPVAQTPDQFVGTRLASLASFRVAVEGGKTSFTDLVNQGAQLQKLAAKEQEKIQSMACGLG